jgi:predicted HTH domain antitoxin
VGSDRAIAAVGGVGAAGFLRSLLSELDFKLKAQLIKADFMKTSALIEKASETPDELKIVEAVKMYETHKVSLGKAAKLAGLSKRDFLDLLGRRGIPVFDYTPEELREEILA